MAVQVSGVQELCYRAKRIDDAAGLQHLAFHLRDEPTWRRWLALADHAAHSRDLLRTVYSSTDSGGVVGRLVPPRTIVERPSPMSADRDSALRELGRRLGGFRSDLGVLPLVRHLPVPLGDGTVLVGVASEHMVHDGRALRILATELALLQRNDDALDCLPPVVPYSEFVRLEQHQLAEKGHELSHWWKHHLAATSPFRFPTQQRRGGTPRSSLGPIRGFSLPAGLWPADHDVFDAAVAALLHALAPFRPDAPVTVNMPWSRTDLPDEFAMAPGNMIDYVPLRLDHDGEGGSATAVRMVRDERERAKSHFLPFRDVLAAAGALWEDDPTPFLQVMVNVLPRSAAPMFLSDDPTPIELVDGVAILPMPATGKTLERHDLGLLISRWPDGVRWRMSMRSDIFAAELHDEIATRFEDALVAHAGIRDQP